MNIDIQSGSDKRLYPQQDTAPKLLTDTKKRPLNYYLISQVDLRSISFKELKNDVLKIEYSVDSHGKIKDIEVKKSITPQIDEQVINAVQNLEYEPNNDASEDFRLKLDLNFPLASLKKLKKLKEDLYMPEYIDGKSAMYRHITSRINKSINTEGNIQVRFVITEEGKLENISVEDLTNDPNIERIIIDIFKTMPQWRPAIQNGKLCAVNYAVPISIEETNKY